MDVRPLEVTRLEGEEERRRGGEEEKRRRGEEERRRGGEEEKLAGGDGGLGVGEHYHYTELYNDNDKPLQFVLWQNFYVVMVM